MHLIFIFFLIAYVEACSSTRALFNNEDLETSSMLIDVYPIEGRQSIAPLYATKGVSINGSCTEAARDALLMIINQARAKGANAIGDIRWLPHEDKLRREPTCKSNWGWLAAFPFLFTRRFMTAEVTAQAYKLD